MAADDEGGASPPVDAPASGAVSPFEARHRAIRHMGIQRHIPREHEYRQLLYGPPGRRVKYPLMSIMHEKELGNCRHALAQRVVAGTLEVTLPFGPDSLHAPKPSKKKK